MELTAIFLGYRFAFVSLEKQRTIFSFTSTIFALSFSWTSWTIKQRGLLRIVHTSSQV
jgi:hypothetical protein